MRTKLFLLQKIVQQAQLSTLFFFEETDGDPVHFEIMEGNAFGIFELDSRTGILTVANSTRLDYEKATKHSLVVKVTDDSKNK